MPNSRFHIGLAERLSKKVPISNIHDFYVGTVFPDAPWMSIQDAVGGGYRETLHRHVRCPGDMMGCPNVAFWAANTAPLIAEHDFFKGYFLHLLLDHNINMMWNSVARMQVYDHVNCAPIDNRRVLRMSEVSTAKWKDVADFADYEFSKLEDFASGTLPDISAGCVRIMQQYGLGADSIVLIDEHMIECTRLKLKVEEPGLVLPYHNYKTLCDMTVTQFVDWLRIFGTQEYF